VEVYRPEADGYSPERLTLVGDLRRALQDHQLEVHYQPQVDLVGGGVVGVEALVRWNHPTRGRIQPDDFIGVAEHTGLIRPLTQLVLDEALRQCRAWRDEGQDLRVSVNLSARSLLRASLSDDVADLLSRHGVPANALCLEVTETSIMADPRRSINVLESLRALGITIAVDDFGTGHSSLAYLKGLPVGEIKIDKSFVLSMVANADDEAIVQTIVDLARNLLLTVVAEGVENEATALRLRRMGCHSAQGYHFARPMPAAELFDWLTSQAATPDHGVIVPLPPTHPVNRAAPPHIPRRNDGPTNHAAKMCSPRCGRVREPTATQCRCRRPQKAIRGKSFQSPGYHQAVPNPRQLRWPRQGWPPS
jgi:EAL domain-containing protein (putative c-di-GMP-specific phosphodiesterase class I)